MFGLFKPEDKYQDVNLFARPKLADTYKDILHEHSARKINRIIENDTFEDSSSVYERFFMDCESRVRIVARGLKKEIFDRPNVVEAVARFLMRDGTQLILDIRAKDEADKRSIEASEFFRSILNSSNSSQRLKINFYRENGNRPFLENSRSVSFGDDRMYRSRSFKPNGDYSTHANADVNFYDPTRVAKLEADVDAKLLNEVIWE